MCQDTPRCPFANVQLPSYLPVAVMLLSQLENSLVVEYPLWPPKGQILPRFAVNFLAHLPGLLLCPITLLPQNTAFMYQLPFELRRCH